MGKENIFYDPTGAASENDRRRMSQVGCDHQIT